MGEGRFPRILTETLTFTTRSEVRFLHMSGVLQKVRERRGLCRLLRRSLTSRLRVLKFSDLVTQWCTWYRRIRVSPEVSPLLIANKYSKPQQTMSSGRLRLIKCSVIKITIVTTQHRSSVSKFKFIKGILTIHWLDLLYVSNDKSRDHPSSHITSSF